MGIYKPPSKFLAAIKCFIASIFYSRPFIFNLCCVIIYRMQNEFCKSVNIDLQLVKKLALSMSMSIFSILLAEVTRVNLERTRNFAALSLLIMSKYKN